MENIIFLTDMGEITRAICIFLEFPLDKIFHPSIIAKTLSVIEYSIFVFFLVIFETNRLLFQGSKRDDEEDNEDESDKDFEVKPVQSEAESEEYEEDNDEDFLHGNESEGSVVSGEGT